MRLFLVERVPFVLFQVARDLAAEPQVLLLAALRQGHWETLRRRTIRISCRGRLQDLMPHETRMAAPVSFIRLLCDIFLAAILVHRPPVSAAEVLDAQLAARGFRKLGK